MIGISQPQSRAGEVLQVVHRCPGLPRAEIVQRLGLSSGLASDLVASLVGAGWLAEAILRPSPRAGDDRPVRSGRHLKGHSSPSVRSNTRLGVWRHVNSVERLCTSCPAPIHGRDVDAAIDAVRAGVITLVARFGPRIRSLALSMPGTVSGARLIYAPALDWEGVDLSSLRPPSIPSESFFAGNDATLSAVGELTRGVRAPRVGGAIE